MSWLASPGTNERTIVSLSEARASLANVPPNVIPGVLVATSPVALRTSAGACILGSKVSIWLGPPCMNRKMTALSVSNRCASVPLLSAGKSEASDRPPNPRLPIRRNWRRPNRASPTVSMGSLSPRRTVSPAWTARCATSLLLPSGDFPSRRYRSGRFRRHRRARSYFLRLSAEELAHWFALGQAEGPASLVVELGGGIEAKAPEDGSSQVSRRHRVRSRVST